MNILLIAATPMEANLVTTFLGTTTIDFQNLYTHQFKNHTIDVLVTGVGILHTSFHLSRLLAQKSYDLAFNFGIAGSFQPYLSLGQCVWVTSQIIADLGIEKENNFLPISQFSFYDVNQFPYEQAYLHTNPTSTTIAPIIALEKVKGITVNRVTGSQPTIDQLTKLFTPTIENMEGAAFFYACLQHQLPFYELRAISNYVTVRNENQWNIPLAIQAISKLLINIIKTL